jgi:hypothetical protein
MDAVTIIFLALLFGAPAIVFVFTPRRFRWFCLAISFPLVVYFGFFPHSGADNMAGMVDALAFAVFGGALLAELGTMAWRALRGKRAGD